MFLFKKSRTVLTILLLALLTLILFSSQDSIPSNPVIEKEEESKFVPFDIITKDVPFRFPGSIRLSATDSLGNHWFATHGGIVFADSNFNDWQIYTHILDQNIFSHHNSFVDEKNDRMFFSDFASNSLIYFDIKEKTWGRYSNIGDSYSLNYCEFEEANWFYSMDDISYREIIELDSLKPYPEFFIANMMGDSCGNLWGIGSSRKPYGADIDYDYDYNYRVEKIIQYDKPTDSWKYFVWNNSQIDFDTVPDTRSYEAIYVDKTGKTWMSYADSLVVFNCKNDHLNSIRIPEDTISYFYQHQNDSLILIGRKKLYLYTTKLEVLKDIKNEEINQIKIDRANRLWLLTSENIYYSKFPFQSWENITKESKPYPGTDFFRGYSNILFESANSIWVLDYGVFRNYILDDKRWKNYDLNFGLSKLSINLPDGFPFSIKSKDLEEKQYAYSDGFIFSRNKNTNSQWHSDDLLNIGITTNAPRHLHLTKDNLLSYYSRIEYPQGRSSSYHFPNIFQPYKGIVQNTYLINILGKLEKGISSLRRGFGLAVFQVENILYFNFDSDSYLESNSELISKETNQFIFNIKNEKWFSFNNIYSIVKPNNSDQKLYVISSEGFEEIDWEENQKSLVFSELQGEQVINMAQDKESDWLWFGSENKVFKYNLKDQKIEETLLITSEMFKSVLKEFENIEINQLNIDNKGTLWLSLSNGIMGFPRQKILFNNFSLDSVIYYPSTNAILEAKEDLHGHMWFKDAKDNLIRYNSGLKKWNQIRSNELNGTDFSDEKRRFDFDPATLLPDSTGAIWSTTEEGITRQQWDQNGIPFRPEVYPYLGKRKWQFKVSSKGKKDYVVWRNRPTGILQSNQEMAEIYAVDNIFPVNVMEEAPGGGAWIGYTLGGLNLRQADGSFSEFDVSNGLPQASILDISQVPNTNEALAWVATNKGAVLVNKNTILLSVFAETGPVDVLIALEDGGAVMAFNPLSKGLFLDHQKKTIPRQKTFLKIVNKEGKVLDGQHEVPRGEVKEMALGIDGKVVWLGTTAGLYRFDLESKEIDAINANNQLQPQSIYALIVDPEGTVWMGHAQKEDAPATIIGYSPKDENIRFFAPDGVLPDASQFSQLDFTPDGNIVVMADGKMVTGQIFVPKDYTALYLLLVALVSGGLIYGVFTYLRKRERTAKYKPFIEVAQSFFTSIADKIVKINYRTLNIFIHKGALSQVGEKVKEGSILHCSSEETLYVEEVQEAYKKLSQNSDQNAAPSYLLYPNEIDPAASRLLDTYRLRDNTVIIPISVNFVKNKIGLGLNAIIETWNSLLRRYLGRQDLFDMRNALDEPRFFFGRQALIDDLFNALNRREHIAILGMRKVGKSSLLNLLSLKLHQFPIVKLDLQLYNRNNSNWPDQVLKEIVTKYDQWGRARFGNRWNLPSFEPSYVSGTDFREALRARQNLQRSFQNDQPLIIMLDEIERIFPQTGPEHGIPEHAENFIRFSGTLRALGQVGGERLLSLIIADLKPTFNRVNHFKIPGVDNTNPFYRFLQEVNLKPLNEKECENMVKEISHAMGLDFEKTVIEKIFRDSGGFPALARQLASAATLNRQFEDTVKEEHYEQGLHRLIEEAGDVDRFFRENFWDSMEESEKRIAALASNSGGVVLDELEQIGPLPWIDGEVQASKKDPPSGSQLLEARRSLISSGILEKNEDRYRISSIKFQEWLSENVQWPD